MTIKTTERRRGAVPEADAAVAEAALTYQSGFGNEFATEALPGALPEGQNSPEWPIEQVRASEAAARIFWPLGNTKLEKRLPLITAPTLLLWGAEDRIMPRGYAERFARGIAGKTEVRIIPGAGHLAELDKPDEVAAAILAWTR